MTFRGIVLVWYGDPISAASSRLVVWGLEHMPGIPIPSHSATLLDLSWILRIFPEVLIMNTYLADGYTNMRLDPLQIARASCQGALVRADLDVALLYGLT